MGASLFFLKALWKSICIISKSAHVDASGNLVLAEPLIARL